MNKTLRDLNQLKAANPELSAWVSANAGSGKTHVLVNRIARLLLAGAEPSAILCLTYTNAAAAEMASRIYARLGGWTGLDDDALRSELAKIGIASASADELNRARKLFALALDTPGGFKIQTIHGFCERILQLFPLEAGMAPGFRILDDKLKKELLKQAQEQVLTDAVSDPGSVMAQALAVITQFVPAEDLDAILEQYLRGAPKLGAPGNALDPMAVGVALRQFFRLEDDKTLEGLREDILAYDEQRLREASRLLMECPPSKSGGLSNNAKLGKTLDLILNAPNDSKRLSTLRSEFLLTKAGERRKLKINGGCKNEEFVSDVVLGEASRMYPLLCAHDELLRVVLTVAVITVAQDMLERFKRAKKAIAAYDFDDLIAVTRDLLTDRAAAAWVLYKLDKGIEHVLVDEAQDTSPAQWQIMEALTAEFFAGDGSITRDQRTLFVVGDQKQSIFSFQGADVRIFESSRRAFQLRAEAAALEMPNVPLTTSFRSAPAVLDMVDNVFAAGTRARTALGIGGEEGLTHAAVRDKDPGLFELWPLTLPAEKAEHDIWDLPQGVREAASPQRLLARKIARTVKGWIGQRWTFGEQPLVSPGDILILFRKRSALFDMLIAELRAAGVPVAGTDRLDPGENLGVRDMLALMRVVTLAHDDHALACVLKSPLVSRPLSEEQLLKLAYGRRHESLWQRLAASEDEDARQCLRELVAAKELAERARPFEFISAIMLQRRPAIAARLGREAEDALAAFADQALAYEDEHGASIAGFAEWFEAEDLEIKRDMEAQGGEVRLMTVHGSKGLEARIVILPDTVDLRDNNRTKLVYVGEEGQLPLLKLSGLTPSKVLDDEKSTRQELEHSEYARLLYVAMTRARDALFVCGAGDKQKADARSWYGMVQAALDEVDTMQAVETLCGEPGLRYGEAGLWAPADHADATVGVAQIPAYLREAWTMTEPKVRGATATSIANPSLAVHAPERARRGRLVHRILQTLPELPPEQRLAYAERVLRPGGLEEELPKRLMAIIEAPDWSALFGEGSEAEVAVGTRLPDGTPFTGTIDRLAIGEHGILIVDYKSDAAPRPLRAVHPHVRQLASYCYTLQKIHPGKPIKAGILWTATASLEWVEPSQIHMAIADITGQATAAKA